MGNKQLSFQTCCVCKRSTHAAKRDTRVSYFKFPNTPERKFMWIKRLQLDSKDLKGHSKVCNAHFKKDQLRSVRLIKKALPVDNTTDNERVCNDHESSEREKEHEEVDTQLHRLVKIRPRQLFSSPVQCSNLDLCVPTNCGITKNKLQVIIGTESETIPTTNVEPTRGKPFGYQPAVTGFIGKHEYSTPVANYRKKLKRLQQKTSQIREAVEWLNTTKACKKEAPMYFEWLRKQFLRFGRKGSPKFDLQEKALALTFYYSCGQNGYRTQQKMGFKLPSCSQVRRWLQSMHFLPGVNEDVLRVLGEYCEELDLQDRDCVLTWDEMSIKEFIEYEKNLDYFEGIENLEHSIRLIPATEALVLMISGVRKTWSFPVSFYFSCRSTKSDDLKLIVERNLEQVQNIGYRVRVGICDMSFTNQGLYKRWKISDQNPFVELGGQKIYMIHDSPHLLKLIRNNLMNKTFRYTNLDSNVEQIAKWSDIKNFYSQDTKRLVRMAPKLTKLHVEVKSFSKMKVKLATQLLSHSVAAGIKTMVSLKVMSEEALQTAEFIDTCDKLFDMLNCLKRFDHTKDHKSADFLINNLNVLNSYHKFVKSIAVSNVRSHPKCFNGLALTIRGVQGLINDLKHEGYKYVLTRKLQQDCLENLFSIIRMKGGWSKNPTAREFRNRFKYVFIKGFVKKSNNSNCQDTYDDDINCNLRLLNSLFTSKLTLNSNEKEISDVVDLNVELGAAAIREVEEEEKVLKLFDSYAGDSSCPSQSRNIAVYLASYCVKKGVSRFSCDACKSLLVEEVSTNNPHHTLTHEKAYSIKVLNTKTENPLAYVKVVSQVTTEVFLHIIQSFVTTLSETLDPKGVNVLRNVETKYLPNSSIRSWLEACDKPSHRFYMIRLLFRVLLFRLVKDKNEKVLQSKSWSQKRIDLKNQ